MALTLTFEDLLGNLRPGGGSCFTSVTELAPAAGAHASVAPAKFAIGGGKKGGTYAYETRFNDDGVASAAVVIDTKQSQLNRVEDAILQAIDDGHEVLARLPRVVVAYGDRELTELALPHRIFDAHIRAGSVDGTPVTQLDSYIAARDASPNDASALFNLSPTSLIFGAWDSSRANKQGRWRSILVGEIVGFCAKPDIREFKGGARIDPLGQRIDLSPADLKALAERQRGELSKKTYDELKKASTKAATAGLGGIPPVLDALAGVACTKILRSHVLSFAALRQLRFGKGSEGDAACRALLAALALAGLARADGELLLRANCDLVEASSSVVTIHGRGGEATTFSPLSVDAADSLLAEALSHAETAGRVAWNGIHLKVIGDPAIAAGAVDDAAGEE